MEDYNLTDYMINGVLATIMLGVGLSLTLKDFKRIFQYPKAIIIGLSSQLVLMPCIAFAIAFASNLSPEMKVGLVIISICPGGASSNLIIYLLRGNLALAVTFTIFNSIITLFSIPAIANLALFVFLHAQTEIHLPFLSTVIQIFIITIIPVGIGVFIRQVKTEFAEKLEKPLDYILSVLLGTVFIVKIFASRNSGGIDLGFIEAFAIFPFVFLLNLFGMFGGYAIAKISKLGMKSRFTIGIEVGMQNTAMALLISGTLLSNAPMQKPALVYATFSFFTAILFGWIMKKIRW